MKPRVVRDAGFEFRAVQGQYDKKWLIEFRVVGGNWDHRTSGRQEVSPALTGERIRLWAGLLDQPYDLTFEPEGDMTSKHAQNEGGK